MLVNFYAKQLKLKFSALWYGAIYFVIAYECCS